LAAGESDPSEEHYKDVMTLLNRIFSIPLDPPNPNFFLVAHAMTAFIFAIGEFEGITAPDLPVVVQHAYGYITKLVAMPGFGKRTANATQESEEDEDDIFGTGKKLTPEEYYLFGFSQCARLFHLLLSEPEYRHLFVEIGNPLLKTLCGVIPAFEFPQLQADCIELVGELALLCLQPPQVKIWEELESTEQILEGFIEEDTGEGSEILDSMGDFKDYDAFPLFPYTVELSLLESTVKTLLQLSGKPETPLEGSLSEDGSMSTSAVASIIIGIIGNLATLEEAKRISKECIDIIVGQLRESNSADTCLAKMPLFITLGHLVALIPEAALVEHFPHLLNLFESVNTKEQEKQKPKPAGRGKGGRGGRGGRGRGRGGGGGQAAVDPEKEKEFKLLQRVLAKALAHLLPKGGVNLIASASKFLNSFGPALKYRDIMFHYLICLKTVLSREESKTHPNFQAASDILQQKTGGQFQFVVDSVKAKFGLLPKKLEGVRCITKLLAATTGYKSGVPLFPDLFARGLDVLLDALNNETKDLGTAIFASIETFLKSYPTYEVLEGKVPTIINICLKVLNMKPEGADAKGDDEEGDDSEEALISSLHLSAFDILQVIAANDKYKVGLKAHFAALVPIVRETLKSSVEKVEENFKLMVAAEMHAQALEEEEDDDKVEDVTEAGSERKSGKRKSGERESCRSCRRDPTPGDCRYSRRG